MPTTTISHTLILLLTTIFWTLLAPAIISFRRRRKVKPIIKVKNSFAKKILLISIAIKETYILITKLL